jgi:hypothetical protein
MKKIIPDMEALALKKNITLKNEIAPLPAIWGDETHLKILFSHLLDNAIKFTPENG